jgi:hypothetical protein
VETLQPSYSATYANQEFPHPSYSAAYKNQKNTKNHAISLPQIQGNPQYNIRQEITIFFFKETLKQIENHFKTKTTQTKFLF